MTGKPLGTHDPGWQHERDLRVSRRRAPDDEYNEAATLKARRLGAMDWSNFNEAAVRRRLPVGTRVRMSLEGLQAFPRYAEARGTVTKHWHGSPVVLWDHRKTADSYAPWFITRERAPVEAKGRAESEDEMNDERLSEAEWRLREDLRANWAAFCDADPFEGSDTFTDRMEAAGYCELVSVTKAALQDPFAYERGIEPGGMMWQLTEAGRAALTHQNPGAAS
jgi:hypothetical protein